MAVRKKKSKAKGPRDKGTLVQRSWLRVKDAYERGDIYNSLHKISLLSSGVAAGLMAHPNPKVRQTAQIIAAVSVPVTIASGVKYHQWRLAYRRSPRNLENLERIFKTEDTDWLRQVDYAFAKNYAIDPKRAEKKLRVTTVGAARKFASARGLRKAPNAPYSIRKHEGTGFYNLARPLLQYHVGKLPESEKDKRAILEHHFPGEGLDLIEKSQLPKDLVNLVSPRLLEANPQNAQEAVSLAVLGGAVARAREKKFKI